MQVDCETVVAGGGVVGLAIAAALAAAGQEVTVLESNNGIGQETSSRNSEVIHAGIYYPKGSLKARHCVDGKNRLYKFAAENAVPFQRLGKLIVATTDAEVAKLESIAAAAKANSVDDLSYLNAHEAAGLEPEIKCLAALMSPSTGIIDSHSFMLALEGHLTTRGGSVVLGSVVRRANCRNDGSFELIVDSGGSEMPLTARNFVAATGHGMAQLAACLPRAKNAYLPPPHYLAKGHYYTLSGRTPFRHLIYPVPVEGGLGIHLTLDLQGRARFGPDVQWIDTIDYAFDDADGKRRLEFERSVRRYWPGLPAGTLEQGYTGIRPKISGKGQPNADFAIHGPAEHGVVRMVALYGIESPGLTSALAIAAHVANLLEAT